MPVMGGLEATAEIIRFEKLNHLKHIPIIALTANALQGDREKYMEAGMDNYAAKPIDLEQIYQLLLEYFSQHLERVEEINSAMVFSQKVESGESGSPKHKQSNPIYAEVEQMSIDILLYHPIEMISSLYERVFQNLGYRVKNFTELSAFKFALKRGGYRAVVYYAKEVMRKDTQLMQFITMNKIKQLVLIKDGSEVMLFKCDTFVQGDDVEKLQQKLENLLKN